jgi:HSP20 family protein
MDMITRLLWDPFESFIANNTLDWVMSDVAATNASGQRSQNGYDISEDGEGYTLRIALPGIDPKELELSLTGQVLTIRGEPKEVDLPQGARYHLRERAAGHFERSIRFPLPVEPDAVDARYEHGVLTVWMPKAEAIKPRRITVQAQSALTADQPAPALEEKSVAA